MAPLSFSVLSILALLEVVNSFHQIRFSNFMNPLLSPYKLSAVPAALNFADDFVDCISEGKSATLARPVKRVVSMSEEKSINFADDAVECVSSSGRSLSVSSATVDDLQEDVPKRSNELLASLQKTSARLLGELKTFSQRYVTLSASEENLLFLCDEIDRLDRESKDQPLLLPSLMRWKRYQLLTALLSSDVTHYQHIVTTRLLPRQPPIPRSEFPNLQNIPLVITSSRSSGSFEVESKVTSGGEEVLVRDCALPKVIYQENALDKFLLGLFRKFVQEEIGYQSSEPGIRGLLDEATSVKLSARGNENDSAFQHAFVKRVLGKLLTPVLPPFYRLFMAGLVPSRDRGDPVWLEKTTSWLRQQLPETWQEKITPGKQLGPFFYAPFLTSVVTPPLMSFLLGPCRPNRRLDGQRGGMIVEKCKFLQESNCKGLCLHQCKIPAQQYFKDELGVDLTVKPNFITQECQWSWGEMPLPHDVDSDFPKGCVSGCQTRKTQQMMKQTQSSSPTPASTPLSC
eukprot:gene12835-14062_t